VFGGLENTFYLPIITHAENGSLLFGNIQLKIHGTNVEYT
jgi:hypothetical protein